MENCGEQFLHQRDSELHTTNPVKHEQERKKIKGEKSTQKPAEKIADFMAVLEKTHLSHREEPRVLERLKRYYHQEYVIKEAEIPESYFENQRRLAREQGYGDIDITDEQKEQLAEVIISDQKSSLNNWLDYYTSPDSNSFPMWAKYWSFNGLLKLANYDKKNYKFNNRTKDTVAPFADLNREALAYTIDAIVKKAQKQQITQEQEDPEFKKLLQGANFGKLYAYAIEKVTPAKEAELQEVKGEWLKYNKGSDHMPLVKSLQGHGTGWCTAGEQTAQTQLKGGDFYVYYSYDKNSEPTIPRIAIRMQDNKIAEVRGVAPDQNLDPYITEVVDQKLSEFGQEGKAYQKKTKDMKRLTEIDNRAKQGQELTKDDLRFLYELDNPIKGFGYQQDPRIKELIKGRDIKQDLSFVLNISPNQISLTKEEALKGGIIYHYGYLDLRSLTSADGLKLPESIGGDLYLESLTSADDLKLPESIGGDLYLESLTSAEKEKLKKDILS